MQTFPSRTVFLNINIFLKCKANCFYQEQNYKNVGPNPTLCEVIHISGICIHVAKDNYACSFLITVQHIYVITLSQRLAGYKGDQILNFQNTSWKVGCSNNFLGIDFQHIISPHLWSSCSSLYSFKHNRGLSIATRAVKTESCTTPKYLFCRLIHKFCCGLHH